MKGRGTTEVVQVAYFIIHSSVQIYFFFLLESDFLFKELIIQGYIKNNKSLSACSCLKL